MGLRAQEREGGLDLLPQRGGEDIDLTRDELQRALLWEMRREYVNFPLSGQMLSWTRLTSTRTIQGRPTDFIGTLPATYPRVHIDPADGPQVGSPTAGIPICDPSTPLDDPRAGGWPRLAFLPSQGSKYPLP